MGDLEYLEKELIRMAKNYPRETQKFLRQQGSKLKTVITKRAKSTIKKKTGNYLKGIKRGKPYKYKENEYTIRVYNSKPHAHLIEKGHIIRSKDGKEHGFKKGYGIFEKAEIEFREKFIVAADKFLDEIIKKGGF